MKEDTKYGLFYWIALVVGLLGIIGHFVTLPLITAYSFALIMIGLVLFIVTPLLDDVMHV